MVFDRREDYCHEWGVSWVAADRFRDFIYYLFRFSSVNLELNK